MAKQESPLRWRRIVLCAVLAGPVTLVLALLAFFFWLGVAEMDAGDHAPDSYYPMLFSMMFLAIPTNMLIGFLLSWLLARSHRLRHAIIAALLSPPTALAAVGVYGVLGTLLSILVELGSVIIPSTIVVALILILVFVRKRKLNPSRRG